MGMTKSLCAAALALGVTLGGPALAQQTYTLRLNHVLGPREAFHAGFQDWAKRVEARTDGGLKIQVFHSAQLGVEEDIIEQMRQGANIGQNTDAARLGTYVPGIAVVNGPYLVETLEEVGKLADAPTLKAWRQELADRHGLTVVCFDWVQGHRNFFTNKPVRSPADLAGQRVRTPPAPIWQESVRALGASPVAMAFGDMYPALQQQAIDGVELVYGNIASGRFYEVLKFASPTRHILLVNFQVVGSKFFNSLPPDYQKALVEECRAAGQATSRKVLAAEAEQQKALEQRGMTVVGDVDTAAFRAAGDKAYDALGLTDEKNAVLKEIGKAQ